MLFTATSKLATVRRSRPKTAKNSFQKVCLSACSLADSAHTRENAMARSRTSVHERFGIAKTLTKARRWRKEKVRAGARHTCKRGNFSARFGGEITHPYRGHGVLVEFIFVWSYCNEKTFPSSGIPFWVLVNPHKQLSQLWCEHSRTLCGRFPANCLDTARRFPGCCADFGGNCQVVCRTTMPTMVHTLTRTFIGDS